MVSMNTVNTAAPERRRSAGSIRILTSEYKDELDALLAANKQRDQASFENLMERVRTKGTKGGAVLRGFGLSDRPL